MDVRYSFHHHKPNLRDAPSAKLLLTFVAWVLVYNTILILGDPPKFLAGGSNLFFHKPDWRIREAAPTAIGRISTALVSEFCSAGH